jgi:uncharacterized membrane protein (UPF0136 family)
MGWLQITLLLYGLFNIGLGLFAYLNSGSKASLIGGGAAGLVVLLAVLLTRSNPKIGYIISGIVAIALLGRFVPIAMKKQEFYPSGLIALASALVLVCLVVGHFTQASDASVQPEIIDRTD